MTQGDSNNCWKIAIVGSISGVNAQWKKEKQYSSFISYHCIIHEEVLCGSITFMELFTIITKLEPEVTLPPYWKTLLHNKVLSPIYKTIIKNKLVY